jgi:arsenate reductase
MKAKVLFLCTGNSCRSQMAEGWAKALLPELVDAYSAGTKPQGLNPLATSVMAEAGVDISRHTSKHLDSLGHIKFDLVITVCDNAATSCPTPPQGTKVVHAPFADPPALAQTKKTEAAALDCYRQVRDQIKEYVANALLAYLPNQH